jgi:phospholipid/cholesterol/gamma-HCH transport system ATP-binding protein
MTEEDDRQSNGASGGDRRTGIDRRTPVDPAAVEAGEAVADREREVREAIRRELLLDMEEEAHAAHVSAPRNPVIELQNVSLSFDRPVLEDISFAVYPGETVCVVGESGSGKSTILKLILRLLVPDAGRVFVDGQDVTDVSYTEALQMRRKLGMVFQSAALFDSMTVFENVAYPLREHVKMREEEIEERVNESLRFVDLDPEQVADKLPSALSGGMRKRVGIARGMAARPKIMLYDEPTSGLDPLTTGTITRLIVKLQRELQVSSLVVSHDIRSVFRMATRVVLLYNRRIHFVGTPEEMAASEDRYIRDFLGGY